jgi:hypothetical protein
VWSFVDTGDCTLDDKERDLPWTEEDGHDLVTIRDPQL